MMTFVFHNEDYQIDIIENTCRIGPKSEVGIVTDNESYTMSMTSANMETVNRRLALAGAQLYLNDLPEIIQEHCKDKQLIEIEAIISKVDLTVDEYEQSKVTTNFTKRRRRRETLNCENQCAINPALALIAAGNPAVEELAINTSFGIACTHSDYGTCNGRDCMYNMSVRMHDGDSPVTSGVFDRYLIHLEHTANLGGFCLPCCKWDTLEHKKDDDYHVRQCTELHKGSREICETYERYGRCGKYP
jgi:hypothetical protein